MKQKAIIARFCALASDVGTKVFAHKHAHDCFCGENKITTGSFQFEPEIIRYIEKVVREAIKKDAA